jgi:hypothetical protein
MQEAVVQSACILIMVGIAIAAYVDTHFEPTVVALYVYFFALSALAVTSSRPLLTSSRPLLPPPTAVGRP